MPIARDLKRREARELLERREEQYKRNAEAVKTLEEQREEAMQRQREDEDAMRAERDDRDAEVRKELGAKGSAPDKDVGDGMESSGVFPSVTERGAYVNAKDAGGPKANKSAGAAAKKSGKEK